MLTDEPLKKRNTGLTYAARIILSVLAGTDEICDNRCVVFGYEGSAIHVLGSGRGWCTRTLFSTKGFGFPSLSSFFSLFPALTLKGFPDINVASQQAVNSFSRFLFWIQYIYIICQGVEAWSVLQSDCVMADQPQNVFNEGHICDQIQCPRLIKLQVMY